MRQLQKIVRQLTGSMDARWMPFADAASPDLPLPRLLRLSLFQF